MLWCTILIALYESFVITGASNCHDAPLASACLHGGSCTLFSGQWVCKCLWAHIGPRCEARNPCHPFPCVRKHTRACRVKTRRGKHVFVCECHEPYGGLRCETLLGAIPRYTRALPIHPTGEISRNCHATPHLHPCLNGGSCVQYRRKSAFHDVEEWRCHCPLTHIGPFCDRINPCHPSPCSVTGSRSCQAVVVPGTDDLTFRCYCKRGYTGMKCETHIPDPESGSRKQTKSPVVNPCLSEPCLHNGTCILLSKVAWGVFIPIGFSCICPKAYTGKLCETLSTVEEWLRNSGFQFNQGYLACTVVGSNVIQSQKPRTVRGFDDNNPCMYGSKCLAKVGVDGTLEYSCKCVPGTHGRNCSSGCPHGKYGQLCKKKCGFCVGKKCHSVDGTCANAGCLPGWDSSSETCTVQKGVAVSLTTTLIGRYDVSLQNPASEAHQNLYTSVETWIVSTCKSEIFSSGCSIENVKFSPGSVKVTYNVLLDEQPSGQNISQMLTRALAANIDNFASNSAYSVNRNSILVLSVTQHSGVKGSNTLLKTVFGAIAVTAGFMGTVFVYLLMHHRRKRKAKRKIKMFEWGIII